MAGCAEDAPGAEVDSPAFSIARLVRFHLDNENFEKAQGDHVDPYDFVTTTLVVTVGPTATRASALTVAYTDRAGAEVERPLSDFTANADLAPGAQVMIEDANLTSGAVVKLSGVEVASRARGPVEWWTVGGYPIGVAMEPGSSLKYKLTSASSQSIGVLDLDVPEEEVRIDTARASFGVTFDGELELSYAETAESVQAEAQHMARPLAWRTTGHVGIPVLLEVKGTDVVNGTTIEAGFELVEPTGIDYDAYGTMWWNDSLAPVRLDLEGGSYDVRFDAIAWLTGIDEENFSCAGKARADACRPTEIPIDKIESSRQLEAESEHVDGTPWNVDSEALANLTRLLAEDLRPGDEMRFDLDLDQSAFPDEDDLPQTIRVKTEAVLRAVGYETVTVGAGSFEALKVVERVTVFFEIGATENDAGHEVGAITIDESLAETDFWLQKDTFVPLRIEQRMPFDVQRVMTALVEAAPPEVWEEAGVEAPDPSSFEFTLTGTMSLELTGMTGTTRFAPWALFTAFHGLGMAAAAPFMGVGMGPGGGGWADGEQWAAPEPGHLVLESAAPLSDDGLVKDYRIVDVSADLWYHSLDYRLDGENLQYAWWGDEAPSWCVVDEELDACDDSPKSAEVGDVVRIHGSGPLEGATFEVVESVYDGRTGESSETVLVSVIVA